MDFDISIKTYFELPIELKSYSLMEEFSNPTNKDSYVLHYSEIYKKSASKMGAWTPHSLNSINASPIGKDVVIYTHIMLVTTRTSHYLHKIARRSLPKNSEPIKQAPMQ